MPLDQGLTDSVADVNLKNLGDNPAFYNGLAANTAVLALQNLVAHQNRVNVIAEAALSNAVSQINSAQTTPEEAVALVKATSGNDLAQQISALAAAIASIQQQMKGANTTPPETGTPAK